MNIIADNSMVLKGADFSRRFGLSRAYFTVRTMHLFEKINEAERLSFLLETILYQDIMVLKEISVLKGYMLIGGRRLFRDMFTVLLKQYFNDDISVMCLSDEVVENACPRGAWELWCERKMAEQI